MQIILGTFCFLIFRMEVVMRDKMVQQLQKNLNESSAELSQLKIDLTAYEKQCSSKLPVYVIKDLTRGLATAERALKHHEVGIQNGNI